MDWPWCILGRWEGLQAGGGMESGSGNRVEERSWVSCGSLLLSPGLTTSPPGHCPAGDSVGPPPSLLQLTPGAQRALGQDTRVGLALDVRGVRLLGGEGDQQVGGESCYCWCLGKTWRFYFCLLSKFVSTYPFIFSVDFVVFLLCITCEYT